MKEQASMSGNTIGTRKSSDSPRMKLTWASALAASFEFLQIVEGEIRSGRGQIETLVANLDHAQNAHPPCRAQAPTSVSGWLQGEALRRWLRVGLTLSKMLACLTLVKLLNNSTFLVTAV